MFNSTVLDVVIGLVFIYLLYSLLATILQEIVATNIGLRSLMLKKGIARMLDDDNLGKNTTESKNSVIVNEAEVNNETKATEGINENQNSSGKLSDRFYSHPLIKYFGKKLWFHKFLLKKKQRKPSYITSGNFSKVIIDLLRGDDYKSGTAQKPLIEKSLESKAITYFNKRTEIEEETLHFLKSIWADSQGDVEEFKAKLELWFNDTMERVSGWYKKKVQLILFIIGFLIAVFFNVDTISIAKRLSTDKTAREQIVSMASAYLENNPKQLKSNNLPDTIKEIENYKQKQDSLYFIIKEQLDNDIAKANTILGLGGWPPDTIIVPMHILEMLSDSKNRSKVFSFIIDELELSKSGKTVKEVPLVLDLGDKLHYLKQLILSHFWGFLLTALAISLGSSFWFDLLNKLMKLRNSIQQKPERNSTNLKDNRQQNIKIVG